MPSEPSAEERAREILDFIICGLAVKSDAARISMIVAAIKSAERATANRIWEEINDELKFMSCSCLRRLKKRLGHSGD